MIQPLTFQRRFPASTPRARALTKEIYAKLTALGNAHGGAASAAPYTLDYVDLVFTDFEELHGDRAYADDHSHIVGGLARFNGQSCMS
jgi:acetyl-CoA carboxylase carboxyl transferase subunit alpha